MKKQQIYIVDDDILLGRSLRFLFSTLRLEAIPFASGVEFLDRVGRLSPGCIIADVRMPGLSGLELQQELAARGLQWPNIFMTGAFKPMTVRSALLGGAVDVLSKPLEEQSLIAALQKALLRLQKLPEEVLAA
jgi:FixJ family two-component response regulator